MHDNQYGGEGLHPLFSLGTWGPRRATSTGEKYPVSGVFLSLPPLPVSMLRLHVATHLWG